MINLLAGYGWQERDWNQNGSTSLSEFFFASEVGKRNSPEQPDCIEYFAYKDGMAIKTVCNGKR